jgi:Tn3 transposase DDE domain
VYIERTVQTSARSGQAIDPGLFKFLSPLGWEHINLTGDYQWTGTRLAQGKFGLLRTSSHPERALLSVF